MSPEETIGTALQWGEDESWSCSAQRRESSRETLELPELKGALQESCRGTFDKYVVTGNGFKLKENRFR